MDSNDVAILQDAFERALALRGDERNALLAEFGEAHPELGARLAALLEADSTRDELAVPISRSVTRLLAEQEERWIGRRLGAWTLVETIGSGGMGAVFRAERSDGAYEQAAAVKIMAAQFADRHAASRFFAERQILASLNHPHIARLIDGGSSEDGLPYLVMELVDGERIDHYCDGRRLGIVERLELFVKICASVDYAHRQLVIHRDLKPGNILVTAEGEPKVLDFGIARLLEPDEGPFASERTLDGPRSMTPEYASPEQVRGQRVSVASDIYSLGVLLFRLLTGQSPYAVQSSSQHEVERAILDIEPKRPSTVVSRTSTSTLSEEELTRIGEDRHISTDGLRRRLSGDLDNIVLKCLQKQPERRYPSAQALADDIERYLTSRPVLARGDGRLYQARKFVRRNAVPLGAAAVVVLTIAGLTGFYTHRLASERDRAELAARQANEVSDFLSNIFESASPFVSQGHSVTAIELLERATQRIEALAGQPDLQARLLVVVGESYRGLGDHRKELEIFQRALEVSRKSAAPDPETMIDIYNGLGESQRLLGSIDKALANRRRALALSEIHKGIDHPESAAIRARIGATLSSAGRCKEAMPLLQQATGSLSKETGEFGALRLNALGVLAVCYDSLGRYDQAERIGRDIVRESEATLGKLEPNTIIRVGNLALVLRRQWKLEASAKLFREAMVRADRSLPADHADRADYRNKLANALQKLGRFKEAKALYAQATDLTLANAGADSLENAASLYYWGGFYRDAGDFPAATEAFAASARLASKLQGKTSYIAVLSKIYLAASQREAGRVTAAERTLEAITPSLGTVGADHQANAELLRAQLESERGHFAVATKIFQQVLSNTRTSVGADNPALIPILIAMSEHFRRSENETRAVSTAEIAMNIGEAHLPKDNWITATATAELALALVADEHRAKALHYGRQAHEVLSATFGNKDYRVVALSGLVKS